MIFNERAIFIIRHCEGFSPWQSNGRGFVKPCGFLSVDCHALMPYGGARNDGALKERDDRETSDEEGNGCKYPPKKNAGLGGLPRFYHLCMKYYASVR
ncbi:MAG: hypothetical protein NC218_11660 [Acetobacter sp.]|nr:hypothetical protein [Acetobacter sp.]